MIVSIYRAKKIGYYSYWIRNSKNRTNAIIFKKWVESSGVWKLWKCLDGKEINLINNK